MRYSRLFSVALFSFVLPFFTSAEHHGPSARHHNALASRMRGELLPRGQTNARATFYDVGLGACGKVNKPSDFIVALNAAQFGSGFPGPHCFKMITITHNGKSAQAQIMDECPGCPFGGLDMSRGLFTFFEPESVGVFSMNWHFNDGSDGPAPPPPQPAAKKPQSSSKAPPKPTSSAHEQQSSKAKSTSTPSSTRATSTSHSTSSASSLATPSAKAAPLSGPVASPQNLLGLDALVGALGKFVAQYAA